MISSFKSAAIIMGGAMLSALLPLAIFFSLNLIFPLKFEIPYSQIILDADGKVLHAFLSRDDKWRIKAEYNDVSPQLKKAIIEKEDKFFYHHFGVNPFAAIRAGIKNAIYKKKTSGASTITMQLARLLKPKERSYANKLIEIFHALQLEWRFSKEELLLMYLNLVPYGGNIEGVKAASLLYFGKLPRHLSLAQVVALTIIPNRPTSLRPGINNQKIEHARDFWLHHFKNSGVFSTEEITTALSEQLIAHRLPAPHDAPHFSYYLKKKYPLEPIIKSTLRWEMQAQTNQLVRNYMERLKAKNISNAAVFLVNNRSHEVEAYIGSANFYDKVNAGQVNGVVAIRSPGSTLKPLVYAVAFDKGLLTPKSILLDIPTDFDGYAPDNFDKKFNGKVTVEKALAYSLNVPAVKTLQEVGLPNFINTLIKAGFSNIQKNEATLGLSMILGGCGVTLSEVTQFFTAFSNEGKLHPVKYLQNPNTEEASVQLISPASSFMITNILSQLSRPDLPHKYESNYHLPKISWKTGTSYGRRDAWSIGYNKNYTLGVWVGNFSGEGVPELTGADIATPLLFDIFNSIEYNTSPQWSRIPSDLSTRIVCEESGNIPEDYCEHVISDYFIPRISSSIKCSHLKRVWVHPDESISYCSSCVPELGYKIKLYDAYPTELKDYYRIQNIPYKAIPPHNPYCDRVAENKGLVIVSPSSEKEFILDREEPAELLLRCNAPYDVNKLYWYINDQLFTEVYVGERVFFKPPPGIVKISCVDDKGRSTTIQIKVSYM